jgi:hypothetical protein
MPALHPCRKARLRPPLLRPLRRTRQCSLAGGCTECAVPRKAQPQVGPAQRVAEAEPMETLRFLQQTGLANEAGRTKDGEGIVEHVKRDAGAPKAIASTELPEAWRLPFGAHLTGGSGGVAAGGGRSEPASRGPFPQMPAFKGRCIRSGFVALPRRTAAGTPRSGASPEAAHRPSRCAASSATAPWRPERSRAGSPHGEPRTESPSEAAQPDLPAVCAIRPAGDTAAA